MNSCLRLIRSQEVLRYHILISVSYLYPFNKRKSQFPSSLSDAKAIMIHESLVLNYCLDGKKLPFHRINVYILSVSARDYGYQHNVCPQIFIVAALVLNGRYTVSTSTDQAKCVFKVSDFTLSCPCTVNICHLLHLNVYLFTNDVRHLNKHFVEMLHCKAHRQHVLDEEDRDVLVMKVPDDETDG